VRQVSAIPVVVCVLAVLSSSADARGPRVIDSGSVARATVVAPESRGLLVDGEDTVMYTDARGRRLTVVNTRTTRAHTVPLPRGCAPWFAMRRASRGRVLLGCENQRDVLMSLTSGAVTELPATWEPAVRAVRWLTLGREWLEGAGECGAVADCLVYLNRRTGERRTRPLTATDSLLRSFDLDAPSLPFRRGCSSGPHARPGNGLLANTSLWFEHARYVRVGRDLSLVRCDGRSLVLQRRAPRIATPLQLSGGFVSWATSDTWPRVPTGWVYVHDIARGVTRRWSVPPVGSARFRMAWAVHTPAALYVGSVLSFDRFDNPKRVRVYRIPLGPGRG
jgi:hypothetical protein